MKYPDNIFFNNKDKECYSYLIEQKLELLKDINNNECDLLKCIKKTANIEVYKKTVNKLSSMIEKLEIIDNLLLDIKGRREKRNNKRLKTLRSYDKAHIAVANLPERGPKYEY